MNLIILTLLIIYLTVVLTKNVITNKDLAGSLPPAIGNIMIFIRDNMNDIFLTMSIMLAMITYFAVTGVSFDAKPKVTLEKVRYDRKSQPACQGKKEYGDRRSRRIL